jgi:hypothetical protein
MTLGLDTVTISFEVEITAPESDGTTTTHALTLQAVGDGGRVWGEQLLAITLTHTE